jgi:hypothetical protein
MLSGGTFDGALAYDVTYYGASHTGTTIELSGAGLNDVTLDLDAETDSVSISYDIVVDGTLELTAGTLMLNGYDVEVIGGFTSEEEGWIAGDQNSDLTFTMALGSNDTVRFTDDHNMLNELNINIASGDNVNIVSDLHVEDVTLTSGGVTIYDNDLMINMSGSITGYNTDNYIRIDGTGSLLMNVDMSGPYVVFPVGTDSYSPANIQVTAGGSGMYFVNVKNEVYSEGVSGNNDALVESVVERTWRIIPTTANATANLQLEWTADAEVNGFDRTNSYISHYATDWDHVNSTAATTTGNTYQLTRSGETLLGSYAVMDEDATVSIEENDGVVFEVFPNPVTEKLNCIINIDEPVKLEVIDVNGSLVSVQAIQNTAGFPAQYSIDFSSYPAGTYFVRVTAGDRQVNHKVVKS